jgi:hypothetical protein
MSHRDLKTKNVGLSNSSCAVFFTKLNISKEIAIFTLVLLYFEVIIFPCHFYLYPNGYDKNL